MNERYIVVSDVHLGGHSNNEPYQKEFCDFLTWIKELPSNGNVDCENGKKLSIDPPTKIVLLGDIMDIWDPKDQDRNNVIKDAVEPLSLLHDINCEKIYVTGNHDEDIEEMATKVKSFEWSKGHNFIFCRRHFPEDEKILKGEEINGLHYSFLHGHQFDKEQLTFKLSQILKTRFDPVDFAQDLANVSLTRRIPIYTAILFLCILSLLLYFNSSVDNIVITGITLKFKEFLGIIFSATGCYLAWKYYKSSKEFENNRNEPPLFSRIFGGIFIVLLAAFLTGIISLIIVLLYQNNLLDSSMFKSFYSFLTTDNILLKFNEQKILVLNFSHIFSFFYWIVLIIVSYLTIVSIIPRLITFFMRKFYLSVRTTRDEKIKGLFKDPGNYSIRKDKMDVNVVVFGHTHMADSYLCKPYLFTWDDIPGNNNGKIIEYLNKRFDIDWVNNAKIEKIQNGKTVKVYTEKNSLYLILNDEKTRVSLKIDDGITDEFVAKLENSKLNIYARTKLFVNTGGWVKEKDDRDVNTFAYINNDGIFLLKWGGIDNIGVLSHYSNYEVCA